MNQNQNSKEETNQFDLRKVNRNILTVALPQILASLMLSLSEILSVTIQQYKFGLGAISQNVIYRAFLQFVTEQLPAANMYFFGKELFISILNNNNEKCEIVLTAYYELSMYLQIILGAIFCMFTAIFSKELGISSSYRPSFLAVAMLGGLFTSLNRVLSYRYLAEFRLFLIFVRGAIESLLQLGLEYFLYTVQRSNSGNRMTMWSYITTNVCLAIWQCYIALGYTIYSFPINNSVNIFLKKVLIPTKELFVFQVSILAKAFFKYLADITLPLTILISQAIIRNTFTDGQLMFYAFIDLYLYLYVFGIIRAIPEGFLFSYTFWTSMCVKEQCYSKRQVYASRIMMLSIFVSGIFGIVLYLIRDFYCSLLFNFEDEEVRSYFSHPARFSYTTIISLVMGVLDIFQMAGVFDVMSSSMHALLVFMAAVKVLISGLCIWTIGVYIGDKADYLWVLIFTDGSAIILALFYILTVSTQYWIKYKQGEKLESRK